ncbi:S9 family peptidase [Propionibacterium australiense]|nr:prolyl oligopeptidase family serine peptidase [Propionibacterium australiense]SYZ32486.1 Peptidase S9, prolyl oligopeptidase, catalytic domain [Propionibacterium australiense]VEH90115.1 Prolyl tripeptidyl peptidase precursor [Propionibacterium australiense]
MSSPATSDVTTAPYGSWASPIGLDDVLAAGVTLRELGSDGRRAYWLESRPGEDSRMTLLRRDQDTPTELTPAPADVRARVNEYGGGSWAVGDGVVVWADATTGQVFGLAEGHDPAPLTPAGSPMRFAAFAPCAAFGAVLAVREDHTDPGNVVTCLVALPWPGQRPGTGAVLASGHDFYADPAVRPDGRCAWICWDQPAMPWDATRLVVARLDDEDGLRLVDEQVLVDGFSADPARGTAVQHPAWAPDGSLLFMSDTGGYWNLHRWAEDEHGAPRPVFTEAHDADLPVWQLARRAYTVRDGQAWFALYVDGAAQLARCPLGGGPVERLAAVADLEQITTTDEGVLALVHRVDAPPAIVDLTDGLRVVHCPNATPDPALTSVGVSHVVEENRHGRFQCIYWAPHNPAWRAPAGTMPPLIITVHGGPTGMAVNDYSVATQFWTSRGFAVMAVNYSGSAGFGRAFRERLRGQWGIADVDDCIDAARYAMSAGLADMEQVVITGGSAGGFTVLRALERSAMFSAGVSRYGVADLVALQADTHKFEARYNDGLLGPWPQQRALYEERSPINHLDELDTPMLIFQGTDDPIVPPNQSRALADAIGSRGLPVALVSFEGEGHGFRLPATNRRVLECQLSFYAQLFDFEPADDIETLRIENLDTW